MSHTSNRTCSHWCWNSRSRTRRSSRLTSIPSMRCKHTFRHTHSETLTLALTLTLLQVLELLESTKNFLLYIFSNPNPNPNPNPNSNSNRNPNRNPNPCRITGAGPVGARRRSAALLALNPRGNRLEVAALARGDAADSSNSRLCQHTTALYTASHHCFLTTASKASDGLLTVINTYPHCDSHRD